MIKYTVTIEQLSEKDCSVYFKSDSTTPTPSEVENARIINRHLIAASEEVTQSMAQTGRVSMADGAGNLVDELKETIRRRREDEQSGLERS